MDTRRSIIQSLETDGPSDLLTNEVHRKIRQERGRVEKALRGAVMAGYDGLDVNRHPPLTTNDFSIQSIEPWSGTPPDGANGYRTERYTWHWFTDEELSVICTSDTVTEAMERLRP